MKLKPTTLGSLQFLLNVEMGQLVKNLQYVLNHIDIQVIKVGKAVALVLCLYIVKAMEHIENLYEILSTARKNYEALFGMSHSRNKLTIL